MGEWNAKTSPNVCSRPSCRGPIEGPGGEVEFFDGGEAWCIECDTEYVAHVDGEGAGALFFTRADKRVGGARSGRSRK